MTPHSTDPAPNSLILPETPGAPIACDMTGAADTADERLAEYGRLFAQALIGRDRTADAVEFAFAPKPGVAEWVADLAQREAKCCPFLSYRVAVHADRVVYTIVWPPSTDGGAATQPILDEIYAMPERLGDGMAGLLDRLAGHGLAVAAPIPGRFALEAPASPPTVLERIKAACGC